MEGEIISMNGSIEDKELFERLQMEMISKDATQRGKISKQQMSKENVVAPIKKKRNKNYFKNNVQVVEDKILEDKIVTLPKVENVNELIESVVIDSKIEDDMLYEDEVVEVAKEIKAKKTVKIEIDENQQIVTTNDDLSRRKTEAVKYMIKSLETSNTSGKFSLEEAYNIWSQIAILNKVASCEQDMVDKSNALTFIFKALKVANKRGSFELEESFAIKVACDLFF